MILMCRVVMCCATHTADELDANTSPALLSRVANFFLDHKQYDKAVSLYVTAKQYEQALELCVRQNVKVSEVMAEKMTPPASAVPGMCSWFCCCVVWCCVAV
jgi:hypothetical protein